MTKIPSRTLERIESGETRIYLERLDLLGLAFDMTSTDILARDGKGIQNQVDNSTGSNNGVAFNCVFNQTEKELVEKLIDSKDQIIEGLKREIELYKRKN